MSILFASVIVACKVKTKVVSREEGRKAMCCTNDRLDAQSAPVPTPILGSYDRPALQSTLILGSLSDLESGKQTFFSHPWAEPVPRMPTIPVVPGHRVKISNLDLAFNALVARPVGKGEIAREVEAQRRVTRSGSGSRISLVGITSPYVSGAVIKV